MSDQILLQFVPFLSTIESGFWSKLADEKLNIYKLDDSRKPLKGFYTNTDIECLPCRHSVDYSAFQDVSKPPPLCFSSHGGLYNKNTVEDFKHCDKKALLNNEARILWDHIVNGDAIKNPDLLVRFCLLSFADLKKFVFHYWFAFPALVHPIRFSLTCPVKLLKEVNGKLLQEFQYAVDQYRRKHKHIPPFFLYCFYSDTTANDSEPEIFQLKDFDSVLNQGYKFVFCFCDPSTLSDYPGWPLRNYLTLIAYHWADKLGGSVDVICYKDRTQNGIRSIGHSLFLTVAVASISDYPSLVVGWEKNKKNKFGPRCVDLAENMDPVKLAESSVNLNLKLMRWRLMPSLDLEKLANCKCLLLGSGTLGCNIARALLGWGVTNITLVDNGTVSFSNPVRQTLFEFEDCGTSGGKPKAIAAAERLKKIYPGVNSKGVQLTIPMPGHPIHNNDALIASVKDDVKILEKLIDSHDVVFLLMDTRESRWLPTLLCAVKEKLIINAALGFDSYLVMRHGVSRDFEQPVASTSAVLQSSTKLGCYFCNDVVAPGNSMRDRTLDQQCTVTRPGVSMIASAIAVELMVSILHHPLGSKAFPEDLTSEKDRSLGPVPHQIRGFLSHNKVFYPTTEAFSKCTACSAIVIEAYQSKRFDFLLDVFNSSHSYLEDITGLTLLHQQTASAESDILEFSDSESI